jgi:anti-sigma B factor antagonist
MMTVDGSLGPWKVISVSGNLDAATTPAVRRLFADLIDGGCARLLLDLSGVGFIDSSGLGVLIGSQRRLQRIGGELRVVTPKRGAAALFRSTGLSAAIAVYQTMTDAELDLLGNHSEPAAR